MQQELRIQESSGSSGRGRTAREHARAAPLNGASRAPGDAARAAVAAAAAARLPSRWARSPSECARPCAGRGTGRDVPGGAAGPGFPRDARSERSSAEAESPWGRCPLALLTPLSALRPAGGSVLRPGPRPHVVLFILFPEWQPRRAVGRRGCAPFLGFAVGPPGRGVAEPGTPRFRSLKLSKEMGGWNCNEKELESCVAHLCPGEARGRCLDRTYFLHAGLWGPGGSSLKPPD